MVLVGLAEVTVKNETDDEADVGALESIAGLLHSATAAEEDALAAAAERALTDELNFTAREEFVRDYRTWMEDMFGDGWAGNQRVD